MPWRIWRRISRVETPKIMAQSSNPSAWHVARWPLLAWVETAIKVVGQVFGIMALISAFSGEGFALPGGVRLVQTIIMAILALGLTVAIADRIRYREIISMIFVIPNNFAHWGIVLALLAGQTQYLAPFAALFLLGDIVKLVFIRVHQFTVGEFQLKVMYGLTSVFVVGYALVLLLELI